MRWLCFLVALSARSSEISRDTFVTSTLWSGLVCFEDLSPIAWGPELISDKLLVFSELFGGSDTKTNSRTRMLGGRWRLIWLGGRQFLGHKPFSGTNRLILKVKPRRPAAPGQETPCNLLPSLWLNCALDLRISVCSWIPRFSDR